MIEGLRNVTGPKTESDQTLESMALAGAAAVQRLIKDRDNLRSWASSQHRELRTLRAANEDLRRVLVIRQHYLELATEILGQFERFDGALREALDDQHSAPTQEGDKALVDLAQRLAPRDPMSDPDASGNP